MKVSVNALHAGNVIKYDGKLWVAAKVLHISPLTGGDFVAIEAKALREGNKLQERFRSGETIERVHIDERECTYLFKDENGFTFMDKETFERLVVGADVLDEEQSRWLQDGMEVTVSLYEGTPVGVEVPKTVTEEGTYMEGAKLGSETPGSWHIRAFPSKIFKPSGEIAAEVVASSLGLSKIQLAETIGVGADALYRSGRASGPKAQTRVREMLEIVNRVAAWAGGKEQAFAWYRAEPIPAFGGRTAEFLVKDGRATAVREYLDHVALGSFA